MECHDIHHRLSDLADRALAEGDREAVRAHLAGCAACRGLLADLERVRDTARALGPKTPPGHVWLGLAARTHGDAAARATAPVAATRRHGAAGQWIGLAAALLLVTVGLYFVSLEAPGAPLAVADREAGGNAPVTGSVEAIAEELGLAMQHYERAIAGLEALAKTDASALDPAVRTTLADNIATIDKAIAESRGALAQNPGSEPARESLFEALRRKVIVLQATVTLMNEMRKGNPAGAAEAAAAAGNKRS